MSIKPGHDSPLRVGIEGDELVIRVGINRIDGNDWHPRIPHLTFDDRVEWVRDVIAEIDREEEDGGTPLIAMLDGAIEAAIEQGSMGLASDSFTFIGQCPVCENDCVPLRHTRNGPRCGSC